MSNRRFKPDPIVRDLVIKTYTSGLSVNSTWEFLRSQNVMITQAGIHSILSTAGVKRNSRQLKGARIKPVYRFTKSCDHCGLTFKQLFARHVFCDDCAPDGTWYQRIRRYNVGKKEFDVMYSSQRGLCDICSKQMIGRDIHVDHDHVSGKARGLLCNRCNTKLGVLEDAEFSINAKSYLEKHK